MERIQKLLSNYGFCARRKAEELILAGRVSVNGKTAVIGNSAEFNDTICVDGKEVKRARKIYIMFHKPIGCVTALSDPRFRTIKDYIRIKERVFPVGRLDYNTSGLLLMTNDGDFADEVMHPRNEIKKTYIAGLDREILGSHIAIIENGIFIEGRKVSAQVFREGPNLVRIIIHEGRKRIVRRIFQSLGYRVKSLIRVRIGKLILGNLKPGRWQYLKIPKNKRAIDLIK